MLPWVGLGVLVATLAIRLRWKATPGIMTAIGVLLGLHLIAADFASPNRRPAILMVAVMLVGFYLMGLVALALRSLGPKVPPR
jgi:hypothetical protein